MRKKHGWQAITLAALAGLFYVSSVSSVRAQFIPAMAGMQLHGAPIPDCGGIGPNQRIGNCAPPYQTPVYTPPPDDSIVFGSLLEASGYPAAANTDWVGVAAGNFCGGPALRQLIVAQNQSPNFSLLKGPAPYLQNSGQTASLGSSGSHPWRALAAANLNGSQQEELIAVRADAASGVPDVVIATAQGKGGSCEAPTMVASATIGTSSNSDWVGAAAGNFDGTGVQIALLRTGSPNLVLVRMAGTTLSVSYQLDLPLDNSKPSQWKALAAGDLDGDGLAEVIVARQEGDDRSPTIFAYKWSAAAKALQLMATSTFGNNGNSNWTSATAGDFNADGRQAVVVVKNEQSNFTVLDFPAGATALRMLATSDLYSVAGQNWTGLAATDWLQNDQGADELIAVRAVRSPYRTNIFIHGNPFHRVQRDSGTALTKGQYWNISPGLSNMTWSSSSTQDLKNWMRGTNTDTFLWVLERPGDYTHLVQVLHDTSNWGVNGRLARIWIGLIPPKAVSTKLICSQPESTPGLTTWNALDYFAADIQPNASAADNVMRECKDMTAWAAVAGRLAQDYPQLMGLNIDDFTDDLDEPFTPATIAEIESYMRSQAPWMNFSPTVYYYAPKGVKPWTSNWADLGLTLDAPVYYFRNDKLGECIGTAACDPTVNNAPGEVSDMRALLPHGMLMGIYFTSLWSEPKPYAGTQPTINYDYTLTRMALSLNGVGSGVAYGLVVPDITCSANSYLNDRPCALQKAYGSAPELLLQVTPSSLTFPVTAVGSVQTLTLVLTNDGLSNVTATTSTSPPPHVATFFWNGGTFVIAPGASVSINVTFAARAVSDAQGTLTITSDAVGSPVTVALRGTGVKGEPR